MTNLNEKLINVQSELKAPKGNFNKFGGYKYRSCEDILEAVKPLLAKNSLLLTLKDSIEEVGGRVYVRASATISDGDSAITVDAYAREAETKKGMDDSQITGTASSYARKYALNGLFCIDDARDADTDEFTKQTRARSQGDYDGSKKITALQAKTLRDMCELSGSNADGALEYVHAKNFEDLTVQQYNELHKVFSSRLAKANRKEIEA